MDIYKHPGSMQDALRGDPQQQFGPVPGEQDAQYQQQLAALLRGTRDGGDPQAQQQQQGVDPGQAYDMYNKFAGGSAAGGQAGASSALDASMASNEGGMWGSGISGNSGGTGAGGSGWMGTAGPIAAMLAFMFGTHKYKQNKQDNYVNQLRKKNRAKFERESAPGERDPDYAPITPGGGPG